MDHPTRVPSISPSGPPPASSPSRRAGRVISRVLLVLATLLYLWFIAALTLGPQPSGTGFTGAADAALRLFDRFAPELHINYNRLEFLANIAVFVPAGMLALLWLGRRRWMLALFAGALISAGIELSQNGIPGRVPDLRDVIANGVGGAAGVLAALVLLLFVPRRDDRAVRQPRR